MVRMPVNQCHAAEVLVEKTSRGSSISVQSWWSWHSEMLIDRLIERPEVAEEKKRKSRGAAGEGVLNTSRDGASRERPKLRAWRFSIGLVKSRAEGKCSLVHHLSEPRERDVCQSGCS